MKLVLMSMGRVLSHLNLVDTTPPKAIDVNVEIWQGNRRSIFFVRDIEDISAVNISYEKIPDWLGSKQSI